MNPSEPKTPCPPTYSNVVSGKAAVQELRDSGYRDIGVIHHFDMTWPCGHTGAAIEVIGSQGALKACEACARACGLN